ncbi:hormogonium polysaccharide secretion pseudopilin HpsB [Coleofasciculus chthonoplastes]|uniref:hormogonium polysaccharide secretion pseudopilin HpsB n=1 Tax=Coleofasciculus chthonoplastes TaxID=64178 RepID=UPI0032F9DA38
MSHVKPSQPSTRKNESGFTIIESLVAIIVVTILMIGIAPVIVLAVANRVQAKRVEQATQAARSYIDGVIAGKIEHPSVMVKDVISKADDGLAAQAAPTTGTLTCAANAYCTSPATNLYCVDLDNTGGCESSSPQDLIVQGFGAITTDGGVSVHAAKNYRAYELGVRVYRAYVFGNLSTLEKGETQAAFGGVGLSPNPIVQTSTGIVVDNPKTYKDLCDDASVTGC